MSWRHLQRVAARNWQLPIIAGTNRLAVSGTKMIGDDRHIFIMSFSV
ncbi:hypothetical protein [Rhizobium sp. X9]|nr:hypothetical protein [Rhizobium sp. X9]